MTTSDSGARGAAALGPRLDSARIPKVPRESITDPGVLRLLDIADRLSAPKPAWYLTIAHNPQVTVQFGALWEELHRGGEVSHHTKELGRLAISQVLDCEFCAGQRSIPAI